MATILQKKLAHEIVKNAKRKKPLNKQQLVASCGYGVVTADKHATEVIEQKGVQDELAILGFTSNNAKRIVASILTSSEEDMARLKAADMIFKVEGSYAPEKSLTLTVNVDPTDPKTAELAHEFEERLKLGV